MVTNIHKDMETTRWLKTVFTFPIKPLAVHTEGTKGVPLSLDSPLFPPLGFSSDPLLGTFGPKSVVIKAWSPNQEQ